MKMSKLVTSLVQMLGIVTALFIISMLLVTPSSAVSSSSYSNVKKTSSKAAVSSRRLNPSSQIVTEPKVSASTRTDSYYADPQQQYYYESPSQAPVTSYSSPYASYSEPAPVRSFGAAHVAPRVERLQMQGSEHSHIQPRGYHHGGHAAYGRGWGWGGDEVSSVLSIGIPLIILLIFWPLCIMSVVGYGHGYGSYGGYGGGYGGGWGWGWKRSNDGSGRTLSSKEKLKNKANEIADKVLPKLSKNRKST